MTASTLWSRRADEGNGSVKVTSTVTVPLVAALGLGLASSVPGRSPLLDGFGLIALASLFPMITVMGYAQMSSWLGNRRSRLLAKSKGVRRS